MSSLTTLLLLSALLCLHVISVPIDSYYVPRIELGEVDLEIYPQCEELLAPLRHKCEAQYRRSVIDSIRRHNEDLRTESVRRATCCGIWRARQCVIDAAIAIKECGSRVASMYAELPTDRHTREEVADKCSEYDESAPICKNNGIGLVTTIWQLLFLMMLRFIID